MTSREVEGVPPAKRRKTDVEVSVAFADQKNTGLERPISPPVKRRKSPARTTLLTPTWGFESVPRRVPVDVRPVDVAHEDNHHGSLGLVNVRSQLNRVVASPFQLTRIEDLGTHQNVDTIGLKDILGDPLIRECWNFNFLFDLDFVM